MSKEIFVCPEFCIVGCFLLYVNSKVNCYMLMFQIKTNSVM